MYCTTGRSNQSTVTINPDVKISLFRIHYKLIKLTNSKIKSKNSENDYKCKDGIPGI